MTPKQLNAQLFSAVGANDIELVKEYLEQGADVMARNRWGSTPLHWAAFNGHTQIVELLIEKGANVNAKGIGGYLPRRLAAERGYTKIVELLKQHGGVA